MLGPECKGLKVLYFLIIMLIAKIDYYYVPGTMLSAFPPWSDLILTLNI